MLPKKERFACEYIIDLNATQAAKRAGYSEKTAYSQGHRLLKDAEVKARIEELQAERNERMKITADRVLEEIAKVAFFDIRRLYDVDGSVKNVNALDDEAAAVVSSFKSRTEIDGLNSEGNAKFATVEEYKTYDKGRHLEMLCKHLGLFEKDNSQKGEKTETKRVVIARRSDRTE